MSLLVPSRRDTTGSVCRIRVDADPTGGPMAVRLRGHGSSYAPRIRPMLLSVTPVGARISLVPEGALLLAGDVVEIDIEVGPGAALDLVEPGGTVAYAMPEGRARWDVRVTVADGAALRWHGQPFIVSQDAVVDRDTQIALGSGASLLLRETLVLGRSGELAGRLNTRSRVTGPSGPVLAEDLALGPAAQCPGVLGSARVVDSVLCWGDRWRSEIPEHRFELEGGGLLWRSLGSEVHATGLHETWARLSEPVARRRTSS